MKNVNLKIAVLRKSCGFTQQELADLLGVSFQTVSKWENHVTMPDITMLPALAELFGVSVLDCGCGCGAFGLAALPLLPEGSTYTGIDFAEKLLETGRQLFDRAGLEGRFVNGDFYAYPVKRNYDLVVCQCVLRHVNDAEGFLERMARHTKPGGLVVCIEVNRELECGGLYVEGMDYGKLCAHEGLKKLWACEKKKRPGLGGCHKSCSHDEAAWSEGNRHPPERQGSFYLPGYRRACAEWACTEWACTEWACTTGEGFHGNVRVEGNGRRKRRTSGRKGTADSCFDESWDGQKRGG